MQMQDVPTEPGFPGAGIDVKRKARFSGDAACGFVFYLSAFIQVCMCFAVFASKNSEVMTFEADGSGSCPAGMIPAATCDGGLTFIWRECVAKSLCEELTVCSASRRLGEEGPAVVTHGSWKEALEAAAAGEGHHAERARRRLSHGVDVPESIWEFMEEHAYVPALLFGSVFFAAGVWLLVLQRYPRTTIWGTIITDIAFLLLFFVWFKLETDNMNPALPIIAAFMTLVAVYKRKQIDQCAVVMKAAMDGLASNKQVFLVCAGITCLWACYFALWVAAIIGMSFVKEVGEIVESDEWTDEWMHSTGTRCEIRQAAWVGGWTPFFFLANLYWVTYFLRNVNLMVVTSTVMGWYFSNEGYGSFWVPALRWGFLDLSGGNAIASATMGASTYLLDRVGSGWGLLMACFNPFDWVLVCVGLVLKHILIAFTKYGLIAQVYSGRPFCEAAFDGMKLLKGKLGEAVLTDYIGMRVMSWATYIISLCVAFAAWGWADDLQGVDVVSDALGDPTVMIIVIMAFAAILSVPFWCLLLVISIETLVLSSTSWKENQGDRAILNSIFVSLFIGSITYFILQTVSQIVVNAMDAIFFCFAVEQQNASAKQPRFEQLYDNLKAAIAPGVLPQSAVMGAPPSAQVIQVQVPEGGFEGAMIRVATPQGRQIEVVVPAGFPVGSVMNVSVPHDVSQPAVVQQPVAAAPQEVQVVGNAVVDAVQVRPAGEAPSPPQRPGPPPTSCTQVV